MITVWLYSYLVHRLRIKLNDWRDAPLGITAFFCFIFEMLVYIKILVWYFNG